MNKEILELAKTFLEQNEQREIGTLIAEYITLNNNLLATK
jgi:hypothetical protein